MATIDQLSAALVKADAAGNSTDAKALADEIRRIQAPSGTSSKNPALTGKKGELVDNPFSQPGKGSVAGGHDPANHSLLDIPNAIATGFNKGLLSLAGLPVDTIANVRDLGKAAIGAPYTAITGKIAPDWLQVNDRANDIGSGANLIGAAKKYVNPLVSASNPDYEDGYLQAAGAGLTAIINPNSRAQAINQGITGVASALAGKAVGDATGSNSLAVIASLIPGARKLGSVSNLDVVKDGAAAGRNALSSVTPELSPNIQELAQKAGDYGIPLRPDMLGKNNILKMMGESSEKVPASGSKTQERQVGFNRAIIKQIGGDVSAEKLTPDVYDAAITKSGNVIGDISAKTNIPVDSELSSTLSDKVQRASKFETADVKNIISSYVDELIGKSDNGAIPGVAFRKINSQIGRQMRGTSNGDLKNALGDLQDSMHDALQKNLTGGDLDALLEARKQYAIAKTIEPLVAKSSSGDISPAGLMGRVTSDNAGKNRMARGNAGEIGDIARIGQQFLKEPNSSGTAERGMAYGLLGGGTVLHPAVAAGVYSLANLYNRLGPKIVGKIVGSPPEITHQPDNVAPGQSNLALYDQRNATITPDEFPNWTYGRPDPHVTVSQEHFQPSLPAPSAEGTAQWVAGRRSFDRNMASSLDQAAQAHAEQEAAATRDVTGRGTLFDLDPITGRLREASQGIKGATPATFQNFGNSLQSAAEKVSSGQQFSMSAAEKVAWNKTRVDLATAAPELNALSDSAILQKMMDRTWVFQAMTKAREKADAFSQIAKRADDAQASRAAAMNRNRMLDLLETLDEKMREPKPVSSNIQGPKTRNAIMDALRAGQQDK